MHLHLSPTNQVPFYLQVDNQVKYLVALGRLVPDDELPGCAARRGHPGMRLPGRGAGTVAG